MAAIARRPQKTPTKKRLSNALQRVKSLKQEIETSKVPQALVGGAAVVGGAAMAGAAKALTGQDDIAGVDIGVAGGLLAAGIGIGLKSPALILGGAGMMAPYAHDAAYDAISSWREDRAEQRRAA